MSGERVTFGLIVIGSELLLGKRADGHFAHAVEALNRRGLELSWCQYLGDDPDRIVIALRRSMADGDIVFCFGGIGATPDDHTRACAAQAAGVRLVKHPEAAAIIEARFGEHAYPQRIHMANLPQGCTLIPNPVNQIAGFSLGDHHFVPGFPQMGWPMLDWLLDHRYPHLARSDRPVERLLTLPGTSEGQIIHIIQDLVARFPGVQLSCLPHMDGDYRETELGIRGQLPDVEEAAAWLDATLDCEGFKRTTNEPRS
ncbi:MAG TPA: molybdopterin-binding protein [Gammaproteobacteria bacterium]|nr:molybdopterin-binding protein [Gammaproteobacteria bacterium]